MKLVNIEETNNVGMLRRLNSQQNNHRIHLQFFKHDILAINYHLAKRKNQNSPKIFFKKYFIITLHRVSITQRILL